MMKIKGEAVKAFKQFVEDKFGEEGLKQWMNALNEKQKKVYNSMIFSSEWYSLKDIIIDPANIAFDMFYDGDRKKGGWENGYFNANMTLKGVYKIFVKVATPEFLMKKAATIMSTFYEPCKMEIAEIDKTHVLLRITEFSEIEEAIETTISGWAQRALEICGAKNINIEITSSLSNGDSYTEYKMNWDLK